MIKVITHYVFYYYVVLKLVVEQPRFQNKMLAFYISDNHIYIQSCSRRTYHFNISTKPVTSRLPSGHFYKLFLW